MATAMGDCNGNGDGDGDGDGNGDGNGNGEGDSDGNGDGDGDGDGVGKGDGDGNGDGNGDGHGKGDHYKGRVASSCGGDVQRFWMGDTLPPPPWTQGKCIYQRCIMGVTLLRVFAHLQGGGFLTADQGLFSVYFYDYC
jgi:hypothetical protein